jgi:hypothetical protein
LWLVRLFDGRESENAGLLLESARYTARQELRLKLAPGDPRMSQRRVGPNTDQADVKAGLRIRKVVGVNDVVLGDLDKIIECGRDIDPPESLARASAQHPREWDHVFEVGGIGRDRLHKRMRREPFVGPFGLFLIVIVIIHRIPPRVTLSDVKRERGLHVKCQPAAASANLAPQFYQRIWAAAASQPLTRAPIDEGRL